MTHTKPAAYGIYKTRAALENAVEHLQEKGFTRGEISVVAPHAEHPHPHVTETKEVVGAEVGAGAGAVAGGVLGWLAGAGMLTIPGLTSLIVLGPIATLLVAIGALAGVGGLWGGLVGLGIPEKEAKHFTNRLHSGEFLLTVHTDDSNRLTLAKGIMAMSGAEDLFAHDGAAKLAEMQAT